MTRERSVSERGLFSVVKLNLWRGPGRAYWELWESIERLGADDPVATVRFQISANLALLHGRNDELLWELAHRFAHYEPNYGVAADR